MTRREFLATAGAASQQSNRPNIVLFLADDLGLADLGCQGARDLRTPAIDSIAREGVRFTQAYSNAPLCSPTRVALMTGRYQQRYGVEYVFTPRSAGKGLSPSVPTLSSLLRKAGYRTGIFGKWHLGWEPEFSPLKHGFDEFFGLRGSDHDHYSHRAIEGHPDLWDGDKPVEMEGYTTDLIEQRACAFAGRASDVPFFLYVPFNAVHWPFQRPGKPQDVRTAATWYDGTRADYVEMVQRMDAAVGRILGAIPYSARANTLVVFANDNGGDRLSDNRPAFHRKMTLWEGGIRVPLLMKWPGRIRAGSVSEQPTITMDLTATLLSAARAEKPPDGLEGIDLLPIVQGRAPVRERTFCWRYQHGTVNQRAIRDGVWKLVRDGGSDLLFHMREIVREQTDLAWRHPDKVKELRDKLAAWEKDVDASNPPFVLK